MYDPHASPDIRNEMGVVGRGRLVKARLAGKPAPNVSWFWFATGNCHACKYHVPAGVGRPPECLNKDIPHDDFLGRWVFTNTCPGYTAGMSDLRAEEFGQQDVLDVMRASGMVEGEPKQAVVIIVNEPWSIGLALRAHREQSTFLAMARVADYVARGGENRPNCDDYTDLSDDLEGAHARAEAIQAASAAERALARAVPPSPTLEGEPNPDGTGPPPVP